MNKGEEKAVMIEITLVLVANLVEDQEEGKDLTVAEKWIQ